MFRIFMKALLLQIFIFVFVALGQAQARQGDSESDAEPSPPAETDAAAIEKIPIGIEFPETELVEKYRKDYLSNFGRQWITAALESGKSYRVYARKKIAEMELPACLEYLPLIESAYRPSARSRTGALGLWQFMENSVAPYLQKTRYIDERLDPWKSTDAALLKLKANYERFGDWLLALAAYNSGAGAIDRALARQSPESEKTYWALSDAKLLREETKAYIPKFLAICDIVINQDFFGVEFPAADSDEIEFAFYKTDKPVVVSAFCVALSMEKKDFAFLNPALVYDIAPAGFTFRLPPDKLEDADAAFEKARASAVHIVEKGETLWGISRRYGTTVAELCELNGINEKAILPIGKILAVPIHK
jgi:membrane-bound lytic murein transglycosylase D